MTSWNARLVFFASPELCLLTIRGMTLIASLSGDSRSKGLLAAGMWLMLPTIGVDPPTGVLRYGMGTLYLWDGPGPISVVIGRFAISEVIDLRPHGLPESGLLKL